MFDALPRPLRASWRRAHFWKYRVKARVNRLCHAWRYATGTLSADDAQTMIVECQDSAGWYPLSILSVESVLELAQEVFLDHPELPRLIDEACAYVNGKWLPRGDDIHDATWWAIEEAEQHAIREGIDLVRQDHETDGVDNEGEDWQ